MNESSNLSIKPIEKIFIANRGEVAHRIIRTAHDMGYSAVAVYTDSERDAAFVRAADAAYHLEGDTLTQTYMDGAQLIDIALRSHSDAIHPGYGFLSENADFARAVIEAGLTWIGPDPSVLERLGDKISARQLAESVGVSPVPGRSDKMTDPAQLHEFIEKHGYPVAVKTSDGGGGRGIYILRSDADTDNFFLAHGEKLQETFVEKFIETARHIETQCMRDMHGQFSLVSTRDCSIQRRNQKLIEEAPAAALTQTAHETLTEWSRSLFDAVDYHGVGTCEFLVEGDTVYFLEVNPRLQVEHTVSEEVTGIDLVAQQLIIAQGGKVDKVPQLKRHACEFRITAEDPVQGMAPAQGIISHLRWPLGHGVRIESSIETGSSVTGEFDSMLAKIIVTGESRDEMLARSVRVLQEFEMRGVAHVAPLYLAVIKNDDFHAIRYSTRWFEEKFLPEYTANIAKTQTEHTAKQGHISPTHSPTDQHAMNGRSAILDYERLVIEIDGRRAELSVPKNLLSTQHSSMIAPADMYGSADSYGGGTPAYMRAQPLRRASRSSVERAESHSDSGQVCSPVQAIVVRVIAEAGSQVREGELLMVLESMKMESYVYAPLDGTITTIAVTAGQNVPAGELLLEIERELDAHPTRDSSDNAVPTSPDTTMYE